MGAISFMTGGYGESVKEAFDKAVSDAIDERGNDSYNGTISTCDGSYSELRKFTFEHDREIIRWLQDDDNIFDNAEKNGPARYFKSKDHENLYYFFGIASV